MNKKRKLNYDYKRLKKIRAEYLLALAIAFLIIGIYGMRQNYSRMVELKTAVATADQQNGDVETALRNLREFVYAHMNTDLSDSNTAIKPPIQLKYRYERLAKAEAKKAKKINEQVKRDGERVCLKSYPGRLFNSPRVNCVAKYIDAHSIKENSIPSDLYKFDFISPNWSPDLAGISLLLSLTFFSAVVAKGVLSLWYRSQLD